MSKCYDIYRELCGCEYGDTDGGPELTYCALHRAAPDLLAACITALAVLDVCHCQNGHEGLAASRIRAAIRKAKGE